MRTRAFYGEVTFCNNLLSLISKSRDNEINHGGIGNNLQGGACRTIGTAIPVDADGTHNVRPLFTEYLL